MTDRDTRKDEQHSGRDEPRAEGNHDRQADDVDSPEGVNGQPGPVWRGSKGAAPDRTGAATAGASVGAVAGATVGPAGAVAGAALGALGGAAAGDAEDLPESDEAADEAARRAEDGDD